MKALLFFEASVTFYISKQFAISYKANVHKRRSETFKRRNFKLDLIPKRFFGGSDLPILQKFYFQLSVFYIDVKCKVCNQIMILSLGRSRTIMHHVQ